MKKPVIGILGNTFMTQVGLFNSMERTYVNSDYVNAVLKNGGIPAVIPAVSVLEDPEMALNFCDGILFPGGEDIHPWYYNEEPHPLSGELRPEIDQALIEAGTYCLEKKLPMMGICKGHQLINILLGGSLYQDMSMKEDHSIQHLQKRERSSLTHRIHIQEGTRLAGILGAGTCEVNSMHHQAIKVLGKGLKATAFAADGTIEAMEDEEGLILGLQWHPENLVETAVKMNLLFSDFISTCNSSK
ncbi:gamma-glutamyl-gamma-aminobutyrate hydrolase family protein [Lacrimispora sp. 38-1]|uniref:gamma-glutamyl-gamma-aminobutyrate hydrolase family protein n=1 Tax=Lacrimispora sp. 38-1 TaxID=3125778 RepID=UPI003CE91E4D